jgi:hypothetical protein
MSRPMAPPKKPNTIRAVIIVDMINDLMNK